MTLYPDERVLSDERGGLVIETSDVRLEVASTKVVYVRPGDGRGVDV